VSSPARPLIWRIGSLLLFVGSALAVASALHGGVRVPVLIGVVLLATAAFLAWRWFVRRRIRQMMVAGRADELLRAWHDALADMPNAETTVPLLQATALAASGLTQRARSALERAARGTAWRAAYEHRLLLETLLDAFEGDRALSLDKARELRDLPLPDVAPDLRIRITFLREAVGAVARAFAHEPEEHDATLLLEAARKNALIHWPLRYAAAVVCIDDGRRADARRLLQGAPAWPEESAFRAFHAELIAHASDPQNSGSVPAS
jgi:hypothetical protein